MSRKIWIMFPLILYLVMTVLLLPSYIYAEPNQTSNQPLNLQELDKKGGDLNQVTGDFELFPYLIKVVFFLIVIAILIYFLVRFLSNQSRQSLGGLPLRVLGGIALGQNRSLQVVQVGKKLYVLGVGHDIRLVSEIEDGEVDQWLNREPAVPGWFSSISKWRKKGEQEEESFHYVFQEQLNQLKENRSKAEDELFHSADFKEGRNYER